MEFEKPQFNNHQSFGMTADRKRHGALHLSNSIQSPPTAPIDTTL